ncbi:hypothetical protein F7725_002239 [Dissostichus mawsoni]|uniref:Uncharacterized protein n=1 Tax=Dissostichus mawsoni TaxID=36200 RepID=A0A7J5Y245_DISMA|nr:hypothetical protein F7725_002239 [Dissostichus mawsoni]
MGPEPLEHGLESWPCLFQKLSGGSADLPRPVWLNLYKEGKASLVFPSLHAHYGKTHYSQREVTH